MNAFPLSVVITTCNRPALLRRAVHSVLSERTGGQAVEIIVVDDASTVDLPVFAEPDLRSFRMPANGGPGPARMQGLQLARAPWVLMLDDDDILKRGAVKALLDELDNCDFTGFPVIQFARSNGSLTGGYRLADVHDYLGGALKGDFTPVFNKAVFRKTGLSYPANRAGGEHLLWWRLAREYGIPSFSRVLVEVTDDAGERMMHTSSQIRMAADHHQLACDTLQQFGDLLRRKYPAEFRRVSLARIAYGLLSGQRRTARSYLALTPAGGVVKAALWAASWLPLALVQRMFILYRRVSRPARDAH